MDIQKKKHDDRVVHPSHGPENAEHELKKAYNHAVEVGTVYSGRSIPGVDSSLAFLHYRKAYDAFRAGDRLSAERWARTTKHISRALWHEAKISYLAEHSSVLPYLSDAREEYNLHEYSDTTEDLLTSLAEDLPPGLDSMPREMQLFLAKGRAHLSELSSGHLKHELLRAEHIKAAHEYGRVIECMALAIGAELKRHPPREAA